MTSHGFVMQSKGALMSVFACACLSNGQIKSGFTKISIVEGGKVGTWVKYTKIHLDEGVPEMALVWAKVFMHR